MGEDDRLFHFTRGLRPTIATQLRVHGVKTLAAAIDMAARIGSLGELAGASAASASSSSAPMDLSNIEGLDADTGAQDDDIDAPATRRELREYLNAMRDQRSHRPADGRQGGGGRGGRDGHRGGDRPLPRISHLSEDQVREHMTAGKCFGCGLKDHTSRACPRRQQDKATGRVSWPQGN